MADQTPIESLTNRERFMGWLRFLVFLIGLIMVPNAAAQVYEHWEPVNDNPIVYAVTSFARHLWLRLLLGVAIGTFFLAIVMLFKQRPPWHDAD